MKNKLCLLVHGFNVKDDGVGTVGRLQPYLTARGWDTIMFKMGWMDLLQVRLQNRKHAQRLAETAKNAKLLGYEVIAIGHSNGCAVINLATKLYDAPITRAAYLNPALDCDSTPGPQVERVDVWYSPHDWVVKLANKLPAHDWGNMGAVGYCGSDPRMKNYNKEMMEVYDQDHSEYLTQAEKLAYFGPLIVNKVTNNE